MKFKNATFLIFQTIYSTQYCTYKAWFTGSGIDCSVCFFFYCSLLLLHIGI